MTSLAKFTFYLSLITFSLSMCIAQNKVNLHEGVDIGGHEQWIGAKSKNDQSPLLLFLHGGPGFSSQPYSKKFIKLLQDDFIVAQWDQRGTGITKAWSPDAERSLDLMFSDTEEVVAYLLKRFQKEKLYLVGFSWGNILGIQFAKTHPEQLHAYISVSGLTNGLQSEQANLEWLKAQISQNPNETATNETSQIQIPFNSWSDLYALRKWTAYYSGVKNAERVFSEKLFENWSVDWLALFNAALSINHSEVINTLDCAYFSLISSKDRVANYEKNSAFFNELKAEPKELILFNKSLHEIPSDEPKAFAEALLKIKAQIED